jgi:hypothetical protein
MTHAHTRLTLGLGASLLALTLAGCSGVAGSEPRTAAAAPEKSPAKRTGPPRPASSPASSTSSQPTPSPTPEAATPTASARPRKTDRLLSASQVPAPHDGFSWEATATRRSEGEEPFGTCHKFAMTSIGAMGVVVREFRPAEDPGSATASHLVAEFPDEPTARRALEVLKSWRSQCAEELDGYDRSDVGKLRPVSASGADAGWYLLTYGPAADGGADEGYVDAQGFSRVGKRIAVLQMRSVGQDYDHAVGQEPMSAAVQAASAALD